MAIVVNNPSERAVDTGGSDAVSWMMAVAVIILLALGAIYVLPQIVNRPAAAPQAPGANIQVTLPTSNSGGSTGGTGGTTGGGSGSTQ